MKAKKFKVDDEVAYEPFKEEKSEILRNISEKAVILSVINKTKYDLYDYEIFIVETQKIKKVKENKLRARTNEE